MRSEKDQFLKCGEKEGLIITFYHNSVPNIKLCFLNNAKHSLCLGVRLILEARGVKTDLAVRFLSACSARWLLQ